LYYKRKSTLARRGKTKEKVFEIERTDEEKSRKEYFCNS
jgi:hypothetical protein